MERTERALISSDGIWKAEIFRRTDGTYGFRALRWSQERNGWLEDGGRSGSVVMSADAAEIEARARVPQLGRTARRISAEEG